MPPPSVSPWSESITAFGSCGKAFFLKRIAEPPLSVAVSPGLMKAHHAHIAHQFSKVCYLVGSQIMLLQKEHIHIVC